MGIKRRQIILCVNKTNKPTSLVAQTWKWKFQFIFLLNQLEAVLLGTSCSITHSLLGIVVPKHFSPNKQENQNNSSNKFFQMILVCYLNVTCGHTGTELILKQLVQTVTINNAELTHAVMVPRDCRSRAKGWKPAEGSGVEASSSFD